LIPAKILTLTQNRKERFPTLFIISNELWRVRAYVTSVTFELAIDGLGDKRLGGVNVQ
jgi:hypothetical protein